MAPAGALEHSPTELSAGKGMPPELVLQREASSLGFLAVGVTDVRPLADDAARLQEWLLAGYGGTMGYLGSGPRHLPQALLESARTLIAVALPYPAQGSKPSSEDAHPHPGLEPTGRVADYAVGNDYHGVLKERLRLLADALALAWGRPVVARACVDTAPLLERAVAARSGLGFVGKNTLLIVPGYGSRVLLGELLVDFPLTPRSLILAPRCGSCTRCLVACPTRAFVKPYLLDARRCISYLTIEHQGTIPRELRSAIGQHVFGCDLCQDACPFNAARRARTHGGDTGPHPQLRWPDLVTLLNLGASGYRRFVQGTALRRLDRERLARNAAVALGNSGEPGAIPPLRQALVSHRSALVRGHVAWALGALRASEARVDLEGAMNQDPDAWVREECRDAWESLTATEHRALPSPSDPPLP